MNIKNFSTKFFGTNKSVSCYLNEIRHYKVPTVEEEEVLIKRMEEGDVSAKTELVERNQRFVYSLAKIYAQNEDDVLDYVNEGTIGFYEGLEKFNGTHGTRVLTYCVNYIRRRMNAYLTNTSKMIVRSNAMKIGKKVDYVVDEYFKKHEVYPTETEVIDLIKEKYGIDIVDTRDVYDVNVSSISDELDDDFTVEDNSLYNKKTATVNSYENDIEKEAQSNAVAEILKSIPEEHREMVKMLYGIGCREYSVNEVAEKFEMYPEDVNKLIGDIFDYIRQNSSYKIPA